MEKIGEDFDFQQIFYESLYLKEMTRPWMEITYLINISMPRRTVFDLNNQYTDFEKIEKLDILGVKNFVAKYNQWACEIISKEGGISYSDTLNKIKELLNI